MAAWIADLRGNWDALVAVALAWVAIAVLLGPGFYFLFLYVLGCVYLIRAALKS